MINYFERGALAAMEKLAVTTPWLKSLAFSGGTHPRNRPYKTDPSSVQTHHEVEHDMLAEADIGLNARQQKKMERHNAVANSIEDGIDSTRKPRPPAQLPPVAGHAPVAAPAPAPARPPVAAAAASPLRGLLGSLFGRR